MGRRRAGESEAGRSQDGRAGRYALYCPQRQRRQLFYEIAARVKRVLCSSGVTIFFPGGGNNAVLRFEALDRSLLDAWAARDAKVRERGNLSRARNLNAVRHSKARPADLAEKSWARLIPGERPERIAANRRPRVPSLPDCWPDSSVTPLSSPRAPFAGRSRRKSVKHDVKRPVDAIEICARQSNGARSGPNRADGSAEEEPVTYVYPIQSSTWSDP